MTYKISIREEIDISDILTDGSPIIRVMDALNDKIAEIPPECIQNAVLDKTIHAGDYFACARLDVRIWYDRPETDDEYGRRIERENMAAKKLRQVRNEQDRKTYERLKKKFEGKDK